MRLRAIVLLALLIAAPASAQMSDDPASAANAFYAVYAGQLAKGGGIPDATARLRYSAVLSPRLNAQLAAAAMAQARLSARVKNAVPPVLEGDIFSSLFEGATSWKVGVCREDAPKQARCMVALSHVDPPHNDPRVAGKPSDKPVNWNDTLLLANTLAGWKVDDVLYDASFAFGNSGKLTDMLAMVRAQNP